MIPRRWLVVVGILATLCRPVAAFAGSTYTEKGWTVYVIDPVGGKSVPSDPNIFVPNITSGADLLFGDATAKEIVKVPATGIYAYHASRSISGWFSSAFYHYAGYTGVQKTLTAPTLSVNGQVWVGIIRVTTWGGGAGGFIWDPQANGDKQTQSIGTGGGNTTLDTYINQPTGGTNYQYYPTARGATHAYSQTVAVHLSDSWFCLKRNSSSSYDYTWFQGSRYVGPGDQAAKSTVTSGNKASYNGANTFIYGGDDSSFTYYNPANGAYGSGGATTVYCDVFMESATSTSTDVYNLLVGKSSSYAASSTAWATERWAEYQSQDLFYEGVDDEIVTVPYVENPLIEPGHDSDETSSLAAAAGGGLFDTAWGIVWGKVSGMLDGFRGFFWWAPFFDGTGGW